MEWVFFKGVPYQQRPFATIYVMPRALGLTAWLCNELSPASQKTSQAHAEQLCKSLQVILFSADLWGEMQMAREISVKVWGFAWDGIILNNCQIGLVWEFK